MNKKDLKIEYMHGTGPGGQNKNKLETACRITHIPTGIQAYSDERKRRVSFKKAMACLKQRLRARALASAAAQKKQRRDKAIHDTKRIRTYDFQRGTVKDHRTGKVASLKEVLGKGRIDLLQ